MGDAHSNDYQFKITIAEVQTVTLSPWGYTLNSSALAEQQHCQTPDPVQPLDRGVLQASNQDHLLSSHQATSNTAFQDQKPDQTSDQQRQVTLSYLDAGAYSLMVGSGETYFPAFILALGLPHTYAGLIASVPMFLGGIFQLFASRAYPMVRSSKSWVVGCAVLQSLCFIPLIVGAWQGSISIVPLFLVVGLYWATGMSAGPAWNNWIESTVSKPRFTEFLAVRSRITQIVIMAAFFIGGILLDHSQRLDYELKAFMILFLLAAGARFVSALTLSRHSKEPDDQVVPVARIHLRQALENFKRPESFRFMTYLIIGQITVQIASPYFNPYMLKQLALSYGEYSFLIAAAFIAKILSYKTAARLLKHVGPYKVLVAAAIGVAPLPIVWAYTDSMFILFVMQVASGMLWATYELASMVLIFDRITPSLRLGVLTIYNFLNAAAIVVGAIIGAYIITAFPGQEGYNLIFQISTVLRIATVLLLVQFKQARTQLNMLVLRVIGIRPNAGAITNPVFLSQRKRKEPVVHLYPDVGVSEKTPSSKEGS